MFTWEIFQTADSDLVDLMQGPRPFLPPSLPSFFFLSFFLSFFFLDIGSFIFKPHTDRRQRDGWLNMGPKEPCASLSLAALLQGTNRWAGLDIYLLSVQPPCLPVSRESWPPWASDSWHHPQWEDSATQSLWQVRVYIPVGHFGA